MKFRVWFKQGQHFKASRYETAMERDYGRALLGLGQAQATLTVGHTSQLESYIRNIIGPQCANNRWCTPGSASFGNEQA